MGSQILKNMKSYSTGYGYYLLMYLLSIAFVALTMYFKMYVFSLSFGALLIGAITYTFIGQIKLNKARLELEIALAINQYNPPEAHS